VLVEDLDAAGYPTVEFDPDAPTDPVRAVLADSVDADDSPETVVVYQSGGYGIEPITYVLGPDAGTVAGVVRELV
jgi:hypothetical protein